MEPWALIRQLASAFHKFVAPRYRPELHYMPRAGLQAPLERARKSADA